MKSGWTFSKKYVGLLIVEVQGAPYLVICTTVNLFKWPAAVPGMTVWIFYCGVLASYILQRWRIEAVRE